MRYKILLVDDDATLLKFLSEYFENEGEYIVLTAASGAEALRLAYREHPDLVVLDVMMPGMDGWEVTARLRELSDIPIILLTGKGAEADKLRGFRLGVDDYVVKPFSFAELSARIQAILHRVRRTQGVTSDIIPIGELRVDLNKREVRHGEQMIALTPTEFRLLECLAQRAGRAVAESELIQSVWSGAHAEQHTAAVRRYIWLLRQKIEPDPANPKYLLTVRGYGYRLEVGE